MVEFTHQNEVILFKDICLSADKIQIRKISLKDLRQSLREGVEDYTDKPTTSIALLILYYPLFVVTFTLSALGQDLRYLIFPVVAGFTLMGPLVAIAFFEMSRQHEHGLKMRWRTAFDFIHTCSFAPILALSILMTLLYAGWLYAAELIFFSLFAATPASVTEFLTQLFSTRDGVALIIYGNFVGFLFAYAAMAISLVAFPLILDKPVTSLTAISVSVRAFTENFYVLAVWGIIVVVIMAVGAALFFIGLAVALPILGHSTWHLYRKIVVHS